MMSSPCVHACGSLCRGGSSSSSSATATVAAAVASCTGSACSCACGSTTCCGVCDCTGICGAGCRVGWPGASGWPAACARVALSAAKTAAAPCTFIPAAAKARSWLRTHRLRQPLSVRPGSSLAMAFHVRPCMRTAMSMMLSSSGVHMSPFLLPAPRYAPPAASQLFSVRGLGLGDALLLFMARRFLGGSELPSSSSGSASSSGSTSWAGTSSAGAPLLTATRLSCRLCLDMRRCQRLRTASSVRDSGRSRAILAQLWP
mmetsp:Transcript_30639/g.78182  ORF Transcript_30639/g.78182 Transcript_30639/m.78182 type:complete len:259 (+) Transcript_30639:435-1211(+)